MNTKGVRMARRKQDTSNWEEISGMLTPMGRKNLNKGDALTFMKDGKEVHYKIVKKTLRRVYMAPVQLFDPSEVDIVEKSSI